ncbi:MAG: sugar ABC transporter permease [Clostridia bacterium]|nr:sugar ABC transporter permease [Clostridia bacterium]
MKRKNKEQQSGAVSGGSLAAKKTGLSRLIFAIKTEPTLYLMILPVIVWYILFHYKPLYGILMAFQDYSPGKGIWGSRWIGFEHFINFFNDVYFTRLLKNTLIISVTTLIFSFPAPIIMALLLNELPFKRFGRVVQTISYMPHFISIVVICSMIRSFTMDTGVINQFVAMFGGEPVTMLTKPNLFVPIYVISDIWQELGWNSIIYLAALAAVDPQLYEAAKIDGANRWQQLCAVTLPSIVPTIIIMLVLRMGSLLSVGFEKVMLLYNPGIYETADVISTYVYRKGILEFSWSYSTAIGFFNSVINFILIVVTNKLSKMLTETSLW